MRHFSILTKERSTPVFVGVALSLFFIALSVQAATTISTNIQTDGTLSVTGQSVFTGNVGIGTTTPFSLLHVSGILPRIYLSDMNGASDTKHWFIENNAGTLGFGTTTDALGVTATRALYIANNGRVSMGTTLGSQYRAYIAGNDALSALSILQDPGATPSTFNRIVGFTQVDHSNQYASFSLSSDTFRIATDAYKLSFLTSSTDILFQVGSSGAIDALHINGTTGKIGIGSSTPIANLQVANGSNATTTVEFGSTSASQTKGSCLKLYRTDGTAIYAYVAAGATAFTLTTTACASITNF